MIDKFYTHDVTVNCVQCGLEVTFPCFRDKCRGVHETDIICIPCLDKNYGDRLSGSKIREVIGTCPECDPKVGIDPLDLSGYPVVIVHEFCIVHKYLEEES